MLVGSNNGDAVLMELLVHRIRFIVWTTWWIINRAFCVKPLMSGPDGLMRSNMVDSGLCGAYGIIRWRWFLIRSFLARLNFAGMYSGLVRCIWHNRLAVDPKTEFCGSLELCGATCIVRRTLRGIWQE